MFSSPRRGGIGFRYITVDASGDEVLEDHAPPGYQQGTNNQMELMACIKALEGAYTHSAIDNVERIVLFTDSMYVTENLNRAIYAWPKQKWLNRYDRPVENAELWKDLVRLMKKLPRRPEFKWVKGHAKNRHNKAVDKLAKQSAKGVLNQPLSASTVRRKHTEHRVEIGCVRMRGQVMAIRIITDAYLRLQKLYKYRYEVLTNDNEFFGRMDLIYCTDVLRAGHHYEVRVNDDTKNPRIVEVLDELDPS